MNGINNIIYEKSNTSQPCTYEKKYSYLIISHLAIGQWRWSRWQNWRQLKYKICKVGSLYRGCTHTSLLADTNCAVGLWSNRSYMCCMTLSPLNMTSVLWVVSPGNPYWSTEYDIDPSVTSGDKWTSSDIPSIIKRAVAFGRLNRLPSWTPFQDAPPG